MLAKGPRLSLLEADPSGFPAEDQHGTRERGFRVPSCSSAWAFEQGGASCPAGDDDVVARVADAGADGVDPDLAAAVLQRLGCLVADGEGEAVVAITAAEAQDPGCRLGAARWPALRRGPRRWCWRCPRAGRGGGGRSWSSGGRGAVAGVGLLGEGG